MKKLFAIGLLILLVTISYLFLYQKTAGCLMVRNKVTIHMMKDRYNPENSTIPRCTEVVFTNDDQVAHWPASDIHPTHGIYPEFDPQKDIPPGKSWSFVFTKVGPWRYHDHNYPRIHGVISVTE